VSAVVREYRIRLEGIRFRGTHGVSDSERDLPQDFLVNLELWLPSSVLPETDQLKHVFDYDRVATLVVEEGTRQAHKLLEILARRLLERLLADTPATRASVAITKSRPPTHASVDAVSVELVATRE
jgi:dihydroneopterin aldolase